MSDRNPSPGNEPGTETGSGQNNRRLLLRAAIVATLVAIVVAVLPEYMFPHAGYFGFDATFGFYAATAALSAVALVVVARIVGAVLRRSEDYYER